MSRTTNDSSQPDQPGCPEAVANAHPLQTAEHVLALLEQINSAPNNNDLSLPVVCDKVKELIGDVRDLESQLLQQTEELTGWLQV